MDRVRELERASKQSDDNKSGKYKYAIFINERNANVRTMFMWFIISSCGFLPKKKLLSFMHPRHKYIEVKRDREKKRW